MTAVLCFTATLPLPPSVNRTYASGRNSRTGRAQFYMTQEARAYHLAATLGLRQAGLRPLPPGDYTWALSVVSYCSGQRDCDAGVKILTDIIAACLAVNDKHLRRLTVEKVPTSRRAEHRCEIELRVEAACPEPLPASKTSRQTPATPTVAPNAAPTN